MKRSNNVFSGFISKVHIPNTRVVTMFDWCRQANPSVTVKVERWHRDKSAGRAFVCPVGDRDHSRLQRLIEAAYAVEDVLTNVERVVDSLAIWAEVLGRSPDS